MYAVYEEYRELRSSQHGFRYDWDDLAFAARQALVSDEGDRCTGTS